MSRKTLTIALALVAGLAALTGVALARGSDERPFTGSLDEWRTNEVPADCPGSAPDGAQCLRYEGEGEGTASHMGKVGVERSHTVVILPDGIEVVGGTFTLTAANGDELHGEYDGALAGAPPVVQIDAPYTITGGTGRFEGATGSGTQEGQFDLVDGVGSTTLDGIVGY